MIAPTNYFKVYCSGQPPTMYGKGFVCRVELVFPFYDGNEDALRKALHHARRAQEDMGDGAQLSVWRKPAGEGPWNSVDLIGVPTVPAALRVLT